MRTPEPPPCPPGPKMATTEGRAFSMAAIRFASAVLTAGSTSCAALDSAIVPVAKTRQEIRRMNLPQDNEDFMMIHPFVSGSRHSHYLFAHFVYVSRPERISSTWRARNVN